MALTTVLRTNVLHCDNVWIGLGRCGRFRLFLAIILLIVLVLAGFVICFFRCLVLRCGRLCCDYCVFAVYLSIRLFYLVSLFGAPCLQFPVT